MCVHDHLERELPAPIPVAHAARHGLVDDDPLGRGHEPERGHAPGCVLEASGAAALAAQDYGAPAELHVAVGIRERDAALCAVAGVLEGDPVVGVPGDQLGSHGHVHGGDGRGVGDFEAGEGDGLQVEGRRVWVVVEVGQAGRREGQAEEEEDETRGHAAHAAARAAASAVVPLLPRRSLLVLAVVVRWWRLQRGHPLPRRREGRRLLQRRRRHRPRRWGLSGDGGWLGLFGLRRHAWRRRQGRLVGHGSMDARAVN